MKVTVLGAAGGIGQPLSLLLKTNLPAGSELNLFDVAPFTPGVAADINDIPTQVKTQGFCGDAAAALKGSDLVVVVAGLARKPGMTRADLLAKNAGIVASLIKAAAENCPNAFIAVVTNPVNVMVPLAARVLKEAGCYNPARLAGVTMLDVLRSRRVMMDRKGLTGADGDVTVIGGHSGVSILPLFSKVAKASFSDAEIAEITDVVRNGGTTVVEAKAGAGSATLSMAMAACTFVMTVLRGMNGEKDAEACAYVENPSAPLPFFAQKLVFGKNGIESFVPYGTLSAFEQEQLNAMLPVLKDEQDKAAAIELN
ncbi:MAG: malate dehydrogenase [Desulfovibrionaceae bacterium]|nr:malate dehydrogenase [Desulfovibrionaceae bacterium]